MIYVKKEVFILYKCLYIFPTNQSVITLGISFFNNKSFACGTSIIRDPFFFNFDLSFFENFAAVNHYSNIHSCLVFNFPNKKYFSTPIAENYLDLVDLNKVINIGIFYLIKKEKYEGFKFPYQDRGSAWNSEEFYSIDFSFKDGMPRKLYLPTNVEHIAYKKLLKILWNKFKRRIKILQ